MDEILAFVRGMNPLRPSAAGDGREKVTAGVTGLTPRDRLAVEKFYKQRAHTDHAVAERKQSEDVMLTDGERDATSFEQQVGRPLECAEVMRRLHKLNPNLIFERSIAFPDIMGIYIQDDSCEVRDGLRKRHIVGFEYGFSPEYSVFHKHEKGPKKVTRGWRSLLLLLASKGIINFERACRVFQVEGVKNSFKWKQEVDTMCRR